MRAAVCVVMRPKTHKSAISSLRIPIGTLRGVFLSKIAFEVASKAAAQANNVRIDYIHLSATYRGAACA